MVCEINVTLKDDETKLTKSFLVYDDIQANQNDPVIKDCIEQTMKIFGNEPDSIAVKIDIEVS